MQNLIKRNSGPNRRSGMEGKTLAEKLAQSERTRDTDQDETEAVTEAKAEMQSRAPAAPEPGSADTDTIVAAAKAMRDRYAGREAPAAAAKTCLIVDDSRVIRKVSSKIAISLGYVAIEAENGEEALARCKKAMPDLVLTDWNMPEMDGIEFVEKLRAIPTPKEPVVVFCTSNGEAKDIHDGIAAGADDYIVKPFDEAALKAKLEKLGRG
ncbi:MAG: Response regulator receiver domain [Porphyrobacter sp. HL-46]|nr:MAG: Response regulator receiver domain [Porphyrobacter sp. HL-46]